MAQQELIDEIDKTHKEANRALANKRFDSYAGHFADTLKYKQPNGTVIGKRQLVDDIKVYFNRIQSFSGRYDRKNFEIKGEDNIIETLIQRTTVGIRVFIFFTKTWVVQREGIYEWQKINDSWKIISVEVLSEKVS